MALEAITSANFDEKVTAATGLVVVDFWASWCGPCVKLGPILEELSVEMADKAAWYKVDADQNPDILERFGVSSIPTLLVFNGENVLHSVIGAKPRAVLSRELLNVL